MACDKNLYLSGSGDDPEQDITASGNSSSVAVGKYRAFTAKLRVGGDVTGTNPTLDVTIKESANGTSGFVTVATFPQLIDEQVGYIATATPRYEVPGEDPLVRSFSTTKDYIRAEWTIGGTVSPTFNDVSIELQPMKGAALQHSGVA